MSDTAEDEVSKSNGPKEVDEGGRKTEISLLNIPCLEKEDDVLPGNETTALGAATRTSSPSKKIKKTSYLLLTVLCGILLGISLGFLMGLSVFFVEIIDTFQESRAQTSLIQSVCFTVQLGSGALGSVLLSRFGVMRTGLFGGVLATVGCVAASFAPSVLVLVVCIGALTGLGLGLLHLVAFSVMGETVEDEKLRRLLLTLMMFRTGIGGIIYPYFGSVLIAEFGWRGAFLLLGGILLHCCPITMALCSLKSRIQLVGGKTDKQSQPWWKTLNLSLFRSKPFLVVGLSRIVISTFAMGLNLFLVDIAQSKGFDSQTGAVFVSIMGLANLGGRVLCVLLLLFFSKISTLALYFLALFPGGLSVLLITYANTYPFMLVAVVLYGIPWGPVFLVYPAVLMEVVGSECYTSAFGYINTVSAAGNLIGSPLGGALRDLTGTYDAFLYVTMSASLASSASLFVVWCFKRRA